MGSSGSKTESGEDNSTHQVEDTTNGGLHVIEVHGSSVGASLLLLAIVVLAIFAIWSLVRFCKKLKVAKSSLNRCAEAITRTTLPMTTQDLFGANSPVPYTLAQIARLQARPLPAVPYDPVVSYNHNNNHVEMHDLPGPSRNFYQPAPDQIIDHHVVPNQHRQQQRADDQFSLA